jgi:hypothetical protein
VRSLVNLSVTGTTTISSYLQGTTTNGYLDLRGDSGATNYVRIADTGNVTVQGGSLTMSAGNITLSNTARVQFGDGNTYITGDASSDYLAFVPSGTEAARFDSSRNFLLGATSTSNNAQFYAIKTYSAASGTDNAVRFVHTQNVASTGGLYGLRNITSATHTSGTVADMQGISTILQLTGSGGTTTSADGIRLELVVGTGHAATTAATLRLLNKTRTGTIGTGWALYSADTDASYLAGALRIGTTSATSTGTEVLRVSGSVGVLANIHRDSTGASWLQYTNTTTGTASSDGFIVGIDANEAAILYNQESTPLIAYTNATERLRISANNAIVAIGHTDLESWASTWAGIEFARSSVIGRTDADVLYMNSNVYYDGGNFRHKATGAAIQYYLSAGEAVWRSVSSAAADAVVSFVEKMRLTNSGELQIGSYIQGTTTNGYLDLRGDSGATSGVRITDAGNVGIGTTVPGQKLDVGGSIQIADAAWIRSNAEIMIGRNSGTNTLRIGGGNASDLIAFYAGGAQKLTLHTSGNLLLGGATSPTTGTATVAIFSGTAPTAVAADSFALYSSDLSAGNTIPSIWTEGTGIYAAGTPAAATGSIAIRINGTVYHFTVSTTAAS